MGLPGAHAGPRIYPPDRAGRLQRRLSDQLEVERLSRHPRPHLRPPLRARLPAGPPRGAAGRDLPAEAGRGRPEAGHRGPAAEGAGEAERQAGRLRRGGAGVADGRARSGGDRLRGRRVRFRFARRRHDAQPDPEIPSPRRRDRRGDRLRALDRRPVRRRAADQQPQGAARRRLRRDLRRMRRAARARPRHPRPARSGGQRPGRNRMAGQRVLRPHAQDRPPRRRPRRRKHGDGLLPERAAPRRGRGQGRGALGLRRDEGLPVGEGGRRPRGRRNPQLPRAQGLHPRAGPPDRASRSKR